MPKAEPCNMIGGYPIWNYADILGSPSDAFYGSFRDRVVLLCVAADIAPLYGDIVARLIASSAKRVIEVPLYFDESTKDFSAVLSVCKHAQEAELGRRDVMVALGGGVCSDIVRVAASIFRRGIGHVCIPTTLIGQIDAAIGIKGGINFNGAKSHVGSFHAPEAVFIDPRFLGSLGAGALRDGIAEAIKLAVSMDMSLFELIEIDGPTLVESRFTMPAIAARQLIERSVNLTMTQLAEDIYERGSLRRVLDFGHTFSPLIEARSGFTISHGAAVAIDICVSAWIAVELGYLDQNAARRIVDTVAAIGLPTDSVHLSPETMTESVACASRHRGGHPNLVIPDAIGSVVFITNEATLTETLFARALAGLRAAPPALFSFATDRCELVVLPA